MKAAYVSDVAFRVSTAGAVLDPNWFEPTLRLVAPTLGDSPTEECLDWLFFRDRLWRGDISDEAPLRDAASDWLGVELVELTFSQLRTDNEYLGVLTREIGADRSRFSAASADETLHQSLGSSIHVVETAAI